VDGTLPLLPERALPPHDSVSRTVDIGPIAERSQRTNGNAQTAEYMGLRCAAL
jgi:hypothetical protein